MKILLVRFSSIGDIVLTTPVLRCLKKQLACEVHVATKASYAGMVEANPYVDKVWTLKDSFKSFSSPLKKEKYDWVIDLHNNLRTARLKLALGVKSKRFHKLNYAKWKLVKLKNDILPDIHIVDRYLETVRHLGVVNDDQGLDYFFKEGFEPTVELEQNYEVFAIGGQHATKKMPNHKIIELCQQRKTQLYLLGGKEDEAAGAEIASKAPNAINLCGETSLDESAWIIKHSSIVFTHDTGMMHIAAAFNKPIVSFWGNTVPAFGMYPYFKEGEVPEGSQMMQVGGLKCRPCSKIGFDSCPKGHFNCMEKQDLALING